MPPRNTATPAEPSTAVQPSSLADSVKADLLKAQMSNVRPNERLVGVKVMNAGVGMFEFLDTHDTVRDFEGVILFSHPANILWDRPANSDAPPPTDENKGPACQSRDGITGTPRKGFAHLALQPRGVSSADSRVISDGTEKIACSSCPYNRWQSGALVGKKPKGKAVTNQYIVYVLMRDRAAPVALTITPGSIASWEEFTRSASNRGIALATRMTRFTQEVKQVGVQRYGIATFTLGDALDDNELNEVLQQREMFMQHMDPSFATKDEMPSALDDEDDKLPF